MHTDSAVAKRVPRQPLGPAEKGRTVKIAVRNEKIYETEESRTSVTRPFVVISVYKAFWSEDMRVSTPYQS